MHIKVIGSTVDQNHNRHFAASYVIDEIVAIDAGSIGFISCLTSQRKIKHVFLSHTHLDHIASLPMFLDNVYEHGPACPSVYGSQFVRDALMRDLFNERIWPDFVRLSREATPFLKLVDLRDQVPVAVEHLHITPVQLNHVIPTFGFILEDDRSAVAIVSDTTTTEAIWELARAQPQLQAVFLEASFPNARRDLADMTGHLTPELFFSEYQKLGREMPVIAVHIKSPFHDEVVRELQSLDLPQLRISTPNAEYVF